MAAQIECLCGQLKMTVNGDPMFCVFCHCRDCQLVHGGAYISAAIYRTSQTRIVSGIPLLWALKTTKRATCGVCGTRMFAEPEGLGVRSITAHLLAPGVFQPAFHMQCGDAVVPIRDGLPHYKEYPAIMGGSDEQMPW